MVARAWYLGYLLRGFGVNLSRINPLTLAFPLTINSPKPLSKVTNILSSILAKPSTIVVFKYIAGNIKIVTVIDVKDIIWNVGKRISRDRWVEVR